MATVHNASTASAAPATKRRRGRGFTRKRYDAFWGYVFISPWIIGFFAFTLIPFLASFVLSTFEFTLANPDDAHYIGFENWSRLLVGDDQVWQSLGITFLFAAITLPINFFAALFLAILLNTKGLIGRDLFRTLFYAPTMVPVIAAALIWNGVLNPQTGWLNRIIEAVTPISAVGPTGLRWLYEPELVYFAFSFMGLWGIGNTILITLAGLQGVPTDLYDAAEVDGAGWWRRLWNVTMPMISPVLFYNLVLGVIGLLQYFLVPFVLTSSQAYLRGWTRFYMVYFYEQSFQFQNLGYGSALAWFMFIIALGLTLLLFGTSRRWVYYSGE